MTKFYDITTFNGTLNSLEDLFLIEKERIIEFINSEKNSYNDFFEYFSLDEKDLSAIDIKVASYHVTTNNDECSFIREYGLLNTIDAISLNTPLKKHLDKHGVELDCRLGEIKFKDLRYNFGRRFDGFSNTSDQQNLLEHIAYKLYYDRQINGFFCTDNALSYGGNVNKRPEFISNISNLLNYNELVEEWVNNPENKCYVIKFAVPLSSYSVDAFGNIPNNLESLSEMDIDLLKKKCLINYSLNNLKDYIFYKGLVRERISYLHRDSNVPPSAIIKIYSDIEYKRTL